MADILTKLERSLLMSKIKSKWTSQEKKAHNYLKGHKIKHTMHPPIKGNPDIILKNKKIAIFLHGCFWHGCKIHCRVPSDNKEYWLDKVRRNVKRDSLNKKCLKREGHIVLIFWEHDLKNNLSKILHHLNQR